MKIMRPWTTRLRKLQIAAAKKMSMLNVEKKENKKVCLKENNAIKLTKIKEEMKLVRLGQYPKSSWNQLECSTFQKETSGCLCSEVEIFQGVNGGEKK